jgi:hypothetical protein
MMKMRYLLADPRFMARDNEGEGEGTSDSTPADDAVAQAAAAADAAAAAGQTFTQDQVNEIVVKRNKKVRQQLETAEQTVEKLLKTQNLSAQDRSGLEAQLEDLQTQLRTKEQQAVYEQKKAAAEYNARLDETTSKLDFYRNQFETTTRDNAILSAASQHDAYNPEQFISVLSPRTEIVEETNEAGEKTGRLVPRVKVQKAAEDGTVAEVYVTPAEAIEEMKADVDKYGNLFRGNVAKGIGEGSNSTFAGKSSVDMSKVSDADYFANREQYAKQLGIRDRRRTL